MPSLTSERQQSSLPRRVLLVGGDEFRPTCVEMDRSLLALTGKEKPRIAIIPTAAAFENPQRAADNGRRHFGNLGADAFTMDVTSRPDAENPEIVDQVAGADIVYFTGGSPEHLLTVLADSPLLQALTAANRSGTIWAGSSAGAMVLGQEMRRPSSGQGSAALGIAPGILVRPHHERSDPATVSEQLASGGESGLCVLGIDGATGLLLDPSQATVMGAGNVTVYRSGGWTQYASGQTVPSLTVDGPAA